MTQEELAWFAGLVDGEGSFSFAFTSRKKAGAFFANPCRFMTRFDIGLISLVWIERATKVLGEAGINYYLTGKKARLEKNQKPMHKIIVVDGISVYKLAVALRPFLTVKREVAEEIIGLGPKRPRVMRRSLENGRLKESVDWNEVERLLAIRERVIGLNGHRQPTRTRTPQEIRGLYHAIDNRSFESGLVSARSVRQYLQPQGRGVPNGTPSEEIIADLNRDFKKPETEFP